MSGACVRYPRGIGMKFPLAYFALDTWRGVQHETYLVLWDQQRKDRGIPSIFS